MQLSVLTNAKIVLKIFNTEDQSLIEYCSHSAEDFENLNSLSSKVKEYSKFANRHYGIVSKIEEKLAQNSTSHGLLNIDKIASTLNKEECDELKNINIKHLFSLAKTQPK